MINKRIIDLIHKKGEITPHYWVENYFITAKEMKELDKLVTVRPENVILYNRTLRNSYETR